MAEPRDRFHLQRPGIGPSALANYPALIKQAARQASAVAQFVGGVPAPCDGVTQCQPGMELSLFSRGAIAIATAVALSHDAFDGVACLDVCEQIVPGSQIGALFFGLLPAGFVPASPMPAGSANATKPRMRCDYAAITTLARGAARLRPGRS